MSLMYPEEIKRVVRTTRGHACFGCIGHAVGLPPFVVVAIVRLTLSRDPALEHGQQACAVCGRVKRGLRAVET